jgi:hypothetical protein
MISKKLVYDQRGWARKISGSEHGRSEHELHWSCLVLVFGPADWYAQPLCYWYAQTLLTRPTWLATSARKS